MPLASPVVRGRFSYKRVTQTAGTVITRLIDPKLVGAKTNITQLMYVSSTTQHTLTILKPLARTTASAAALAAATSLLVTSNAFRGDTIAASDYIVVQHSDGTFGAYLVSGVGGTGNLTLTIPALTAAVAAGGFVWIMGATGEAEHIVFSPPVSTTTRYQDSVSGIASSGYRTVTGGTVYSRSGNDDPLLVHSNNATAAGVVESVSGYYGSP